MAAEKDSPRLPNTEWALKSAWVDSPRDLGTHRNPIAELAKTGPLAYEIPYDPVKHHRVGPNPLSINSILFGEEFVAYRRPRKPLSVDVIVSADPIDRKSADWIVQAKDDTVKTIAEALQNMHTGFGDRSYLHTIGDAARLGDEWIKSSDYVEETDSPEMTGKYVGEVALNGPTYVIGSLRNLSQETNVHNLNGVIGVMVNHLFELELQPDSGTYVTGEPENPYIMTSDKLQLDGWNKVLRVRRDEILTRLGATGLSVAQIVFKGRSADPNYGFNIASADQSIAEATLTAVDKL